MHIVKQADERRKEILYAAAELFLEKGYKQTSMKDVAEKIGIVKGTCYHYFTTKEHLYNEVLQQEGEKFISHVNDILNDKSLAAKKRLQNAFLSASERFMLATKCKDTTEHDLDNETIDLIRLKCFQKLSTHMSQCLLDGNKEGFLDIDNPYLCANALCYCIFGILSSKVSVEEMIHAMYEYAAALLHIPVNKLKEQ